eukprot:ANDGO_02736.mRNA.1 Branchpoint-bridging protein
MTRWRDSSDILPSGVLLTLPFGIPQDALDAYCLRVRIEEASRQLTTGRIDDFVFTRSPSPPPQYDARGRRVNTRDVVVKAALSNERARLVDLASRMSPLYRPPADFRGEQRRLSRKIYIPVQKYPNYNFVGIIIGPRGHTQKELERESNCRIAIRGRGAYKEGKIRKNERAEEENDDLHVLITGENQDSLDKAESMIAKLLIPLEENDNVHKRKQLKELAALNGTLRDEETEVFEPVPKRNRIKKTPWGTTVDLDSPGASVVIESEEMRREALQEEEDFEALHSLLHT